jgi:hypothetical protein
VFVFSGLFLPSVLNYSVFFCICILPPFFHPLCFFSCLSTSFSILISLSTIVSLFIFTTFLVFFFTSSSQLSSLVSRLFISTRSFCPSSQFLF